MEPFLAGVISAVLAVHMHERATEIRLPFDREAESAPPRRALRVIEGYFARARDAGTVRIDDPRAAARLFLGSLHAYVLYQHVIKLPSYPLESYLDALIDLWSHGGFSGKQTKRVSRGDSDRGTDDRRRGNVRVSARGAKAAPAGAQRDARSANGERRLAGGRARDPRPRR
jgi:hypothetical protein